MLANPISCQETPQMQVLCFLGSALAQTEVRRLDGYQIDVLQT